MALDSIPKIDERLAQKDALTEEEVRELIPLMRQIGEANQRRLYVELALQNLRAIQRFDKSSAKVSQRLLCLTWAILVLTAVIAFAAVIPLICGK